MNQLSVFISCVSLEFCQTRSEVANILAGLGYTPAFQEIFGTEPGDLRQVLRDKIDACAGLIQIIGHGYGAEPPTVDADYGRVSYTQFEFLYAREKSKKTWLLFTGDACTRDTSVELLDLPSDPALPDPAAYQAERRALQLNYQDKRRNDGHVYYDAANNAELKLKVALLRNELAEQRRVFETWQKEVLERLTITRSSIRAHLLESIERTHKIALAAAEKAKGWEERERLRQAAIQARAGRLSHIDELITSFAEIEGTGRATQVFDEMTRILAEEGVDQALAYAAIQRSGILDKVKARAAAIREKNRADLLPLLKSAQLQANRNHATEAARLFADILALEPDWADALDAQLWLQVIEGVRAFHHTMLIEAFGHFQAAEITLQRLLESEPEAHRSQQDLAVVLGSLGDFLVGRGQQGDADKAYAHYQRSLEVLERLLQVDPQSVRMARDASVGLNKLGDFLVGRGQQGDADKAYAHYQRSLELRESLLRNNQESGQAARDVSVSLEKLGDLLVGHGQQGDAEEALTYYQRSLELCENLLKDNPNSGQAARDVSVSLEKLGDLLVGRGQRGDPDEALAHYRHSLELRERLLKDNPDSGQAARDVSVSLGKLGDFLVGRGEQGDPDKALTYYQRSLELCENLLKDNPDSGQAARDISVSLSKLGDFLVRRGQRGDAKKALVHYRRSLELRELLFQNNTQSGQATRDVIVSCYKLGQFELQLGKKTSARAYLKRCFILLQNLVEEDSLMDPTMLAVHEYLKSVFHPTPSNDPGR